MKYSCGMAGAKKTKVSGHVRRAFAENVKTAMEALFATSPNKPKSLASAAGISLSSAQRAISGEVAPNLDTVEAIAGALKIRPSELLEKKHRTSRNGTTG
jgi:transcriptional regulator with XRE-family HTH domain